MQELRPYQRKVVNDVRSALRSGARSVLLVAPTGSGKTRMVAHAVRGIQGGCLALAHRKEICKQISEEFTERGPEKFMVKGIGSQIAIEAVRTRQYKAMFIDEAHHISASSYRRLVENRGNMILIGATATPYRSDGASLEPYFDAVVTAPSVKDLSDQGYLAKLHYIASQGVDFEGIKLQKKGEFEEADALRRVRVSVQAGDLVSSWAKYAKGRNAVIYAINLEHCESIRAELDKAKVPCAIVSSRIGKREREGVIRSFEDGSLRAIINCEVFTEGTDLKKVGAVIMLRPTNSRALYKQMIGRGLRPDVSCVVLDHVGNFMRHGNVMTEDPLEIMRSAKLLQSLSSGQGARDMSVQIERMDLHIERVRVDLGKIWTPSVFRA